MSDAPQPSVDGLAESVGRSLYVRKGPDPVEAAVFASSAGAAVVVDDGRLAEAGCGAAGMGFPQASSGTLVTTVRGIFCV